MKILSLLVLSSAGVWLGYVALHAPQPDYTPPTLRVPMRIEAEAEPGQTMRAFDVEGMCCDSCTHKLYRSLLAVEGVSEAAVDPRWVPSALTFWALFPNHPAGGQFLPNSVCGHSDQIPMTILAESMTRFR